MCGIIGFTGRREAAPILLDGLRRLEYRGYDSAGLVTSSGRNLHVRKKAGRIAVLTKAVAAEPAAGTCGISHTRWATHGGATDRNAHPHVCTKGEVAVVHNGVIENYMLLKQQLQADGVQFRSDTDTEVLTHLIARYYQGDLLGAVRHALGYVRGTYGIAVVCRNEPGVIVGARLGSPLVVGLGPDGHYIASDASALAGYADKVVYLQDRQICQLDEESWVIRNQDLDTVDSPPQDIASFLGEAGGGDLNGFPHHMLKEIYEQPESADRRHAGPAGRQRRHRPLRRPQPDQPGATADRPGDHDGLRHVVPRRAVGEYLFEEFARLPVEVEYASEMRYRNPPMSQNTVVLAITQSGETADTLAAMRESKRMGHRTLAICNVVGSSIAREADGGVYLHAGQEVGVASTKAFTSQVCVLAMLALYFGRTRHISAGAGQRIIAELRKLPDQVRAALECHDKVKKIAERFAGADNALYLGRQYLYPAALEGALKLKEISYVHAEGYAAAEMKHGPIALVDEHTPSVFLVPRGNVFDKVMSNMQEIKARGGPVIAVCSPGDADVASIADEVIPVPDVPEYLQPIVTAIPLQLLAYEIALLAGLRRGQAAEPGQERDGGVSHGPRASGGRKPVRPAERDRPGRTGLRPPLAKQCLDPPADARRSGRRAEPPQHVAVPADQELGEVPLDAAGAERAPRPVLEQHEQRVRVRAVHPHLGEQRERHVVLELAEGWRFRPRRPALGVGTGRTGSRGPSGRGPNTRGGVSPARRTGG